MSELVKRTFDTRYTPEYVQQAIAGKKGKRAARPFLFDLRTFKITTKEGETILNSYLLFGGVPPKAIHDKLIETGFKVRRRPAESNGKDGKTYVVGDRDNDCWTVYYNTESTITEPQVKVIVSLLTYFGQVPTTGKSGLLSSWDQVDSEYGKEEWLQVCTVSDEKKEETKPEVTAATAVEDTVDEETLDTLFS
jgi:hypothetical protein